ncbi:MAG: hypothetical protein IK128_04150 [Clostridiales bacterium]|nr:hypothetical protein [Clostridiales bacterium]
MKKEKIIASVLIAAMALSLSGCDSDNENVLDAAEDYAEALISLDVDGIAELMEDEDEAAEELSRIEVACSNKPALEDAFDAVAESMTYEIDEKSVTSSKKNKEASVDIIFTLVDYEAVHEDIEDDNGNLEDYIDALEDADDTIEVKVTVKFVLVKDKWLVKDKNFKSLNKVYGFIDDISGYKWGLFEIPSEEAFTEAVCAAFGADEDDIDDYAGIDYAELSYYKDTLAVTRQQYIDSEEAEELFDEAYNDLTTWFGIDMDDCEYVYDEDEGGFIFFNDAYMEISGETIYGGIYYKDDSFLVIMSYDYADYDDVDEFLDMLGMPRPVG